MNTHTKIRPANTISPIDRVATAVRAANAAIWSQSTAPAGTLADRLHLARQLTVGIAGLATLVQIIIWLIIGITTGHLDAPWWLWTLATGAVGCVALTGVMRVHRTAIADRQFAATQPRTSGSRF